MARIYVKGYTKKDGTKVPGHYREMGGMLKVNADRSISRIGSAKMRQFDKGGATLTNKRFRRLTRRQSALARFVNK